MHPNVLASMRRFNPWKLLRREHRSYRRFAGQAIVELTLALTFLAYLFAAAVDLGLAYKAYQTLINATAEASSSLKIEPLISCSGCSPAAAADSQARTRFRGEQGNQMGGMASTMDLNANGKDDELEFTTAAAWNNFMETWVRIDPADQSQVTTTNSEFAVGSSFQPTTKPACVNRHSVYFEGAEVKQCFLVVRSKIQYRPFAIAPFVGDTMTITAISVVPTVGMN